MHNTDVLVLTSLSPHVSLHILNCITLTVKFKYNFNNWTTYNLTHSIIYLTPLVSLYMYIQRERERGTVQIQANQTKWSILKLRHQVHYNPLPSTQCKVLLCITTIPLWHVAGNRSIQRHVDTLCLGKLITGSFGLCTCLYLCSQQCRCSKTWLGEWIVFLGIGEGGSSHVVGLLNLGGWRQYVWQGGWDRRHFWMFTTAFARNSHHWKSLPCRNTVRERNHLSDNWYI